jgi:hypothetical protein
VKIPCFIFLFGENIKILNSDPDHRFESRHFQVPDVKLMYTTALRSATLYHKDRRLCLAQLLKDYWLVYRESPGE